MLSGDTKLLLASVCILCIHLSTRHHREPRVVAPLCKVAIETVKGITTNDKLPTLEGVERLHFTRTVHLLGACFRAMFHRKWLVHEMGFALTSFHHRLVVLTLVLLVLFVSEAEGKHHDDRVNKVLEYRKGILQLVRQVAEDYGIKVL